MKISDSTSARVITMEMTEEEAASLMALALFFPVGDEERSAKAEDFAWGIVGLLDDLGIATGPRTDYVIS